MPVCLLLAFRISSCCLYIDIRCSQKQILTQIKGICTLRYIVNSLCVHSLSTSKHLYGERGFLPGRFTLVVSGAVLMIVIVGKKRRTTLFDNAIIYRSIEDNLCCSTGFTTSTACTALKFRTGYFCAGLVFKLSLTVLLSSSTSDSSVKTVLASISLNLAVTGAF